MKKLEFKGAQRVNLVFASLSLSLLVGCGNQKFENPITIPFMQEETAVMVEEIAGLYNSENYYLIRLNGDIYLTTKTIKKDEYNTIERYYDVKTNELVGQVLLISYYDRAIIQAEIMGKGTYDITIPNQIYDYKYFNGSYGYGKNISPYAILPLNTLLQSDCFGEEEMDYYSSNAYELQQIVADAMSITTVEVISSMDYQVDFNYRKHNGSYDFSINSSSKALSKFICEKEEITKTLVGERLSYDKKDKGYDYMYDFISGYIYYIGSSKEDKFDSVVEEEYTGEAKTVAELQTDATIMGDTTVEETASKEATNEIPVEDTYSLSSLYLVIPSNYGMNDSNYYICSRLSSVEYAAIDCDENTCTLNEEISFANKCYGRKYVSVGLKPDECQKHFSFEQHLDENLSETSTFIISFGKEQKVYEMQELDEKILREVYSGFVSLRYILNDEDIKDTYTNDELIALGDKLKTIDYEIAISQIQTNNYFNAKIEGMISSSEISETEILDSFTDTEVCNLNELVLIDNSTLDNDSEGYSLGQNVSFYQPLFGDLRDYVVAYDTEDWYATNQYETESFTRASAALSPDDIKPYYTEEEVEMLTEKVQDPEYQFNSLSSSSLLVVAVTEEEINACAIYVLDNNSDGVDENFSTGCINNKKIMIYNGMKDGVSRYCGLQDHTITGSESQEEQVLYARWSTDSSSGDPSFIIDCTYKDTIENVDITYSQALPLIPLNQYLDENGYGNYKKDGYTISDLCDIEELFAQEISFGVSPN